MEEAKKNGVTALFGEKYDDNVRVISMGNSQELCGGTHVDKTGDIGYFCITAQESVAAGIKRIEAVTREKAVQFARSKMNTLEKVVNVAKSCEKRIVENICGMQENFRKLQREKNNLLGSFLLSQVITEKIGSVNLKICSYQEDEMDFKLVFDQLNKSYKEFVVVLMNINKKLGKTSLFIGVSKEITQEFRANQLLAKCINIISGKGGGNQQIAQASGSNTSANEKVFSAIRKYIRDILQNYDDKGG